jgi:hypothetical protein
MWLCSHYVFTRFGVLVTLWLFSSPPVSEVLYGYLRFLDVVVTCKKVLCMHMHSKRERNCAVRNKYNGSTTQREPDLEYYKLRSFVIYVGHLV